MAISSSQKYFLTNSFFSFRISTMKFSVNLVKDISSAWPLAERKLPSEVTRKKLSNYQRMLLGWLGR